MNRVEEHDKIIELITELEEKGHKVEHVPILLEDIAKSLAVIADRITGRD